jgi:hypothetical protein
MAFLSFVIIIINFVITKRHILQQCNVHIRVTFVALLTIKKMAHFALPTPPGIPIPINFICFGLQISNSGSKSLDLRISRRFEASKQGTGESKVIEIFYHFLINSINAVERSLRNEH